MIDSSEWMTHILKTDIDRLSLMIEEEIAFSAKHKCHFHRTAKYKCSTETVDMFGGCAGVSPYWLLKDSLENALKTLNEKYSLSPLIEVL